MFLQALTVTLNVLKNLELHLSASLSAFILHWILVWDKTLFTDVWLAQPPRYKSKIRSTPMSTQLMGNKVPEILRCTLCYSFPIRRAAPFVMRQPMLCSLRLENVGRWTGAGNGLRFNAGPAAIIPSFRRLGEVGPAAVIQIFRGPGEVVEAEETGVCIAVLWSWDRW